MKKFALWIFAVGLIGVVAAIASGTGDEGRMPDLGGAITWLNSTPLSAKSLRGKVVLVNFWTYSCINSLRELPYIAGWAVKYKDSGLVVIGAHTPEFGFEGESANVENAVRELKIGFPVAVDSNHAIWEAFHNQYWPANYIVDGKGRIRYHHFGEGEYGESEREIQTLLRENGATGLDASVVRISAAGIEAAPGGDVHSPETYAGYAQAERFASRERLDRDSRRTYNLPATLSLNQWGFAGTVERRSRDSLVTGSARQNRVPVPCSRPPHGIGSGKGRQTHSLRGETGWRGAGGGLWRRYRARWRRRSSGAAALSAHKAEGANPRPDI